MERLIGITSACPQAKVQLSDPQVLWEKARPLLQVVDEFKWGTRLLLNKPVANSSAQHYGEAEHLDINLVLSVK